MNSIKMKYHRFVITDYRAISGNLEIDIRKKSLVPIVGTNECGKTTILQAIFCFDYLNDNQFDGKHLKDIDNLYLTSDTSPKISADIAISKKQLLELITDYDRAIKSQKRTSTDAEAETSEMTGVTDSSELIGQALNNYNGSFSISRDLTSLKYSTDLIPELSLCSQDKFCRHIITYLPYILYNDDFMERAPQIIPIPAERPRVLSTWQEILERAFQLANSKYSLFKLSPDMDPRKRDSILSDVQELIRNNLAKAWKTFAFTRGESPSIRLSLEPLSASDDGIGLRIVIVERIGKKERYFNVVDRSKGFLWLFNFIMKIKFNPKVGENPLDTVFLLDEPGSYLHSAAQEKLCTMLKSISDKNGKVIYCTHSHHLLNPEDIPFNDILIVEKTAKKSIRATSLSTYATKAEKTNALQPLYEALQVSGYDFIPQGKRIVCVEGIYDKFALSILATLDEDIRILAGTSADSIIKSIQFLNAYGIEYVAVWDNDNEGRKVHGRASEYFGEHESQRFLLLPSFEQDKFRMEDMVGAEDLKRMRQNLNMDTSASYEAVLNEIYYSSKQHKNSIVSKISDDCFKRFKILVDMIQKSFEDVAHEKA